MARIITFVLVPLMLIALLGCESAQKAPCDKPCAKTCPKEAKTCPVGKTFTYCPTGKRLMGAYEGTVHCKKCNKDMPTGVWCSQCNRFMLEGKVHCDKCNKDMPKGKYCADCKMYMGVPGIAYCEKCKSPYNKAEGCPGCKK